MVKEINKKLEKCQKDAKLIGIIMILVLLPQIYIVVYTGNILKMRKIYLK